MSAPIYLLQQPSPPFPPQLSSISLAPAGEPAHQLTDGWWHLPALVEPGPLRRAAARAVRRQQDLLGYLWDTDAPPAAGALCERDTRSGHDGVTAYSALPLDGADHHVFTAGGPPTPSVRDLQEVTIVSGVCHYSARAARLITESGRSVPIAHLRQGLLGERVVALRLDESLALPEEETSLRLPSLGASLMRRIPPGIDLTLLLDVPHTATALFLLQAAQHGEACPQLVLDWCEAITDRHPRLALLQTERWGAATADLRGPVHVRLAAELEPVGGYLRHALSRNRVPGTPELVDLIASQDRLWRLLVEFAPPQTPMDLADLSYVAALLRAAVSTPDAPRLALAVDNIQEFKIQRRAHSLARRLQHEFPNARFPLAGLYPLGRLWIRDHEGSIRHNLHTSDPGRWAVDDQGHQVDLFELMAELYPAASRTMVIGP
ncbi:hypothetical protein [Nonomuraea sp. NPDC023979]|uniref:hypothetical protein n=1 Tax=Nonomuraea sp. NPDC023979 TaxID=3154796 RepID=UPI0033F6187C